MARDGEGMTDIRFDRSHPFRDSKARLEWARRQLPCCMACGRFSGKWQSEWLVMTTHHIIKPGRSDEPCNLIRLDWFCCHQLAEGVPVCLNGKLLPVLKLAHILWLKRRANPEEFDPERLRELLHENLPEPEEPVGYCLFLRCRSGG